MARKLPDHLALRSFYHCERRRLGLNEALHSTMESVRTSGRTHRRSIAAARTQVTNRRRSNMANCTPYTTLRTANFVEHTKGKTHQSLSKHNSPPPAAPPTSSYAHPFHHPTHFVVSRPPVRWRPSDPVHDAHRHRRARHLTRYTHNIIHRRRYSAPLLATRKRHRCPPPPPPPPPQAPPPTVKLTVWIALAVAALMINANIPFWSLLSGWSGWRAMYTHVGAGACEACHRDVVLTRDK